MLAFTLIPAAESDWARAWAIQEAAFLEAVLAEAGGWTPALVQKCREAWCPATTQLVFQGGVLVGWLRVEVRADHDWLDLLVVAPSAQNGGLGRALLHQLQHEASARGVPLRLSVHRANPARRLYARLGFVELPRDELRVFMVWTPARSNA